MRYRGLWISLIVVMVASFTVLGYFGYDLYRQVPPIPDRVVTASGETLFTGQDIKDGQNVWQSTGGQQMGTVWGHGSYVAPDWSADFLHRESVWLLEHWAGEESRGGKHADLDVERQAALQARLKQEIRTNTYDAASGDLLVSDVRAQAIAAVSAHYEMLFSGGKELADLREAYAIPNNVLPDAERRRQLNAFFFWISWACGTNRPGQDVTYTQNWPPEPLIGNQPTAAIVVWSVLSFVLLLAGIGALSWYYVALGRGEEAEPDPPETDPLLALQPTPSMSATLKYFWIVMALIVVQVGLGGITAHYAVEGSGFYGIPLAEVFPYAVARTWHTQLAIFWIATAFLATGLFIAPAVSDREPKFQRLGVTGDRGGFHVRYLAWHASADGAGNEFLVRPPRL